MKPRIFISSVSRELKSARQLVATTLHALGYEPVWQDIFQTSSDDLRAVLRQQIDSCSAVLQIVGDAYGAEPPVTDDFFGRVSYTQYEALYGRSRGKKVYYLIAEDDHPRDAGSETIDVPRDDSDAAQGDAIERRRLQSVYRQSVLTAEQIYYPVHNHQETELSVRRLRDDLSRLRRGFRNWLVAVSAALVLIAGGIVWLNQGQQQQVKTIVDQTSSIEAARKAQQELAKSVEDTQQKTAKQIESTGQKTKEGIQAVVENAVNELTNPIILAERIRKEIHATAEEKIKALPDEKGRGRLVAEIEKERDLALGRVDDLIKLIQEGLKEGASPVFQRAAEILQKEGTDEALTYLESRRPSTLETARRHAEQAKTAQTRADAEKELRNKSLQALVLEAELLETKLQWQPALKLREQVAELASDWFEARNKLGMLLQKLARYRDAEPHKRAALALAANPTHEAIALSNLANLLQATNRLSEAESLMRRALALDERSYGPEHPKVSTRLSNLASLLQETNRLSEAEPLLFRALAIDEWSYGTEHRKVATDLNILAYLFQDTNRLVEAEPLMRCALAIDEQSYGPGHPNVASGLSYLAGLLQVTNRLAEAEPLRRRALVIEEQSYGPEHPNVATDLNYLARLLQATNRLVEAEPLMRRSLAIHEQSFGAEHPRVAVELITLAELFRAMNRLVEAEPLMRRALVIAEQSYGAEHPEVAADLNNLALLLQATNRLAEAEPLMRRMLEIFHQFKVKTGHEHLHMQNALANYREILQAMKLPEDEISQRVKDATVTVEPLKPIVPEVERLLGPARPVADVLSALDRQHKAEGKPTVYFLSPDQPMAPHLDELFRPNLDSLNAASLFAHRNGAHADSIAYCEESLKLLADNSDKAETTFTTRMNRAVALRELGEVESARDELRRLLLGLKEVNTITALGKGRAHYHLALCEWRLDDPEAALREAEKSLNAYGDDDAAAPQKKQTEQLLADLKENKPLPPLAKVDVVVALEQARGRFWARTDLATLPLNQSALPLLDQMLGPAPSTKEVFETLDRQYREQNKPEIWFLPLNKPIAPHLDELLGPVPKTEKEE